MAEVWRVLAPAAFKTGFLPTRVMHTDALPRPFKTTAFPEATLDHKILRIL